MTALLAVLVGANLCLVLFLFLEVYFSRRALRSANQMTREAHASLDGLVGRINTSERVQVEGRVELPALQDDRPWISDYEYDQPRWDEHVGATEEVED